MVHRDPETGKHRMTETRDAVLTGLTSQEAARRLAADGPNELPTAKKRNLLQQAWDVVREPMLLLLVGAGSVNFLLSEPLDGVILMSFVVVVVAISIYQEHKTENALAALRDLSSPRALVVREGRQVRIAGREVVRDDVVLLAERPPWRCCPKNSRSCSRSSSPSALGACRSVTS
jgi:Ca2+-transporting ATPase